MIKAQQALLISKSAVLAQSVFGHRSAVFTLSLSSFLSALKMAAGMGGGGGGGNPIWSFLWFIGLLCFAFPAAGFCAGWYILLLPVTVCLDSLGVRIIIALLTQKTVLTTLFRVFATCC